jgi:hypothetical protein
MVYKFVINSFFEQCLLELPQSRLERAFINAMSISRFSANHQFSLNKNTSTPNELNEGKQFIEALFKFCSRNRLGYSSSSSRDTVSFTVKTGKNNLTENNGQTILVPNLHDTALKELLTNYFQGRFPGFIQYKVEPKQSFFD